MDIEDLEFREFFAGQYSTGGFAGSASC